MNIPGKNQLIRKISNWNIDYKNQKQFSQRSHHQHLSRPRSNSEIGRMRPRESFRRIFNPVDLFGLGVTGSAVGGILNRALRIITGITIKVIRGFRS